jgi:hypothetical protein
MNNLLSIKGKTMKNEKGMVLVLAIFMLALLSMIGLSSMMTSTTDINIAGNEKFSKIVYYQAESGLTIGGEVARLFYYEADMDPTDLAEIIDDATNIDFNNNIDFYVGDETTDENGLWQKNDQVKDTLDPNENDNGMPDPDLQLTGNLRVDIDIDKLDSVDCPGCGVLFGEGDSSVKVYINFYNVEALATLPANSSIMADHVMGYYIYEY